MAVIGNLQVRMGLDTASITRQLGQFTNNLDKRLRGVRRSLAGFTNLGGALAGLGGANTLRSITREAITFNDVFSDVQKNVKGLNDQNTAKVRSEILKLGGASLLGADGIARLTSEAGKLGDNVSGALEFAKVSEQIAIAFDFGTSVQAAQDAGQIVGKIRTGFNLTTGEVLKLADAMNFFGDNTASNALNISQILSRQGALLVSTTELAGAEITALAASIDAAAPSPEIAATAMKGLSLALTAGAGATKKQSEAFDVLGLSTEDVAEKMQTDASGAILEVFEALKKVDDINRAQAIEGLFGKISVGAIAPLLQNLDQLRANFDKASDSTLFADSVQAEFARKLALDGSKIKIAVNQLRSVGIVIGNVLLPPLAALATKFGNFITKMSEANPALLKFSAGGLLVAGALPPIGFAISGITSVMSGFLGVFKLAIPVISRFLGPIGLATTALLLLRDDLPSVSQSIDGIKAVVGGAIQWFENWKASSSDLFAELSHSFAGISAAFSGLGTSLLGLGQRIIALFGDRIPQSGEEMAVFFDSIFDDMLTKLTNIVSGVTAILAVLVNELSTFLDSPLVSIQIAWGEFKEAAMEAVNALKNIPWKQIGLDMMTGLVNGIKEGAKWVVDAAGALANDIKNKFASLLGISSPSKVFKEYGNEISRGVAIGIIEETGEVIHATEELVAELERSFEERAERISKTFEDVGASISSSFNDAFVDGKFKFKRFADSIIKDMARIFIQRAAGRLTENSGSGLLSNLGSLIGGVFGGFRARGGSVSAGRSYVVGERGPELYTPGRSGTITPNGFGAGQEPLVVNISSGVTPETMETAFARFSQFYDEKLQRANAEGGPGSPVFA